MSETSHDMGPLLPRLILVAIIGSGVLLGLMGIDLVLPAVPRLPDVFGTSTARVQFVLAAYVIGTATGLLVFGDLAGRMDRGWLLVAAMMAFVGASTAAQFAHTLGSIDALIAIRLVQGFAGSAPAVMAPALIRRLFTDRGAVQALGSLGSIESLVPALAPVIGVWLLTFGDWRLSFQVCAAIGAGLALLLLLTRHRLPPGPARARDGSYRALLADKGFVVITLSHAFTVGGLLVFVFGAPAVIVGTMGGGLNDFIRMQITGISLFILSSNIAPRFVLTIGARRMMLLGAGVGSLGFAALITTSLTGTLTPFLLTPCFAFVNLGLGIRGGITFHEALVAAKGDDNRGASLVVLSMMLVAGMGTACVAPFIDAGVTILALVAAMLHGVAVVLTVLVPKDRGRPE